MFTQNFYKLFSTICKLCGSLGVIGYSYDEKLRRVFITPKLVRRRRMQIIVSLLHTLYGGGITIQILLWRGGYSNPDFYICYVYALIAIVELGGLLLIHRREEDLAAVTNQLLHYMVYFRAKWHPKYDPNREMFSVAIDALLFALISGIHVIAGLSPSFFVLFPTSPAHYLYLLPDDVGLLWFAFFWIINFVDAIIYSLLIAYSLMIFICMAIIYFWSTFPLIWREFRGGLQKDKYKTRDELRSAENLSHEYHCLELIHKGLMRPAGLIFLHCQICFAQFCLVCNYSVIKQWHELDPFTTGMLLIYSIALQTTWAIVLELSGRFHRHAQLTLISWRYLSFKSDMDRKFMTKFRKGCYPLAIGERGLFIVTKTSMLKFLRGIVKGTFRALLTVGRKV